MAVFLYRPIASSSVTCAAPLRLAGSAVGGRATFTCWRGVVAVDGGIVAWLARRKRAEGKEPPERSPAQGVTSKVDWAGGGVGEGAAQSAYVL